MNGKVTITTEVAATSSLAVEALEQLDSTDTHAALASVAHHAASVDVAGTMAYVGLVEWNARVHGDKALGRTATISGTDAEDAVDDLVSNLGDILPVAVLERALLRAKGEDITSPELEQA